MKRVTGHHARVKQNKKEELEVKTPCLYFPIDP